MVHKVKDRIRNIQITLVITPSIPGFGQNDHMCPHDVCFDTEFPQNRSSSGVQKAMLSLSEVPH